MTRKQIAKIIHDGLMSQTFVDWYEETFVPEHVEEKGDTEKALKQIARIFRIPKKKPN